MKTKTTKTKRILKSTLMLGLAFGTLTQSITLVHADGQELNLREATGVLQGNGVKVEVTNDGTIKLYRGEIVIAQSSASGYVKINGSEVKDFVVESCVNDGTFVTDFGVVTRMTITYTSPSKNIKRILRIDTPTDINGAIITTTSYMSPSDVHLEEITENEFTLVNPDASKIWSYNGGGEGPQSFYDTIQKVGNGFNRSNRNDEGATGIPISDIYSTNGGLTIGDASLYRRFTKLPVVGKNNSATASLKWCGEGVQLKANETSEVGTSIMAVHDGDYYNGLRTFSQAMAAQGFEANENIPESSKDLRWEGWGWEDRWTIDKLIGKLDELKANGVRQVTIDDCWYTAAGDWQLNPAKFPKGEADMKRVVDEVHKRGMTIALWWRPIDGGRTTGFNAVGTFNSQASNLRKDHPEYFIKNKDGSVAKLGGPGNNNGYNGSTGDALCPQSEGAIESQLAFVRRAIGDWKLDGLKSDYLWGIAKCYDTTHNHKTPEESTQTAPKEFYEAIYNEMISINPNAFHLLCNCGVPQDYYSLPYVTQIPTADPTSVAQTRERTTAYKALTTDNFPITTDHNLDGDAWYASAVGTGSVMIEKRAYDSGSASDQNAKAVYNKWLGIASTHELHRGSVVGGLYSYGIDPYETYVVNKDGMMYYAFYRDGKIKPTGTPDIQLKGLNPDKMYRIEDYVNGKVVATNVRGNSAIPAKFTNYLLVRAVPLDTPDPEEPTVTPKPDPIFTNIDDRDSNLTYSGTWNNDNGSAFLNNTAKYAESGNASVEYKFTGKTIRWYGQKDSNFGTANVYIDGVLDQTVTVTGSAATQQMLYQKTGLADGEHTIKIVRATNTIDIDYFAVSDDVIESVTESKRPALVSVYTSALLKNEAEYTAETWAPFKAKVAETKAILEKTNASEAEITKLIDELTTQIKLLERKVVVNKTVLENAVTFAETLLKKTDVYTPASLLAYTEEVELAKAVVNNAAATQQEVIDATAKLQEAVKVLQTINGDVDRTILSTLIDTAKAFDKTLYVEDSYKVLEDAIKSAETVYNTATTKAEYDAAVIALQQAIDQLEMIKVNFDKLAQAVANAEAYDLSKYTDDSKVAFKAEIEKNKAILTKTDATQEEVDQAVKNITDAYAKLVNKPDPTPDPDPTPKPDPKPDPDPTPNPDPTPDTEDKTVESEDNMVSMSGNMDPTAKFFANRMGSAEEKQLFDSITNKDIVKNKKLEAIYNIFMLKDNVTYTPKGEMVVKIKLDSAMLNKELSLISIASDGTATAINATVKDGYIEFKTTNLTYFAILSKAPTGPVDTGDTTNGLPVAMFVTAGAAMALLARRKKQEERE